MCAVIISIYVAQLGVLAGTVCLRAESVSFLASCGSCPHSYTSRQSTQLFSLWYKKRPPFRERRWSIGALILLFFYKEDVLPNDMESKISTDTIQHILLVGFDTVFRQAANALA